MNDHAKEVARRTGVSMRDAEAALRAFGAQAEFEALGPEVAIEAAVRGIRRWEASPLSNFLLRCEIERLSHLVFVLSGEFDDLREQFGKA